MRTLALTLSIGLLATIAATTPASASCSMGTLKGVYGYYHGRPGGGATITAVLGQIVSDGTGGLSGSWTMHYERAPHFRRSKPGEAPPPLRYAVQGFAPLRRR
jgi:hypothetical protein